MGGTLIRLVDQGHDVHIAYQTSGNIAVFDEDALRFSEFVEDFCREFQIRTEGLEQLETHVDEFSKQKPGMVDSEHVQKSKASFGVVKHEKERDAVVLRTRIYISSIFPSIKRVELRRPISNAD